MGLTTNLDDGLRAPDLAKIDAFMLSNFGGYLQNVTAYMMRDSWIFYKQSPISFVFPQNLPILLSIRDTWISILFAIL